MIYKETVKTGLKDIGKEEKIKNKAILEIFEDVGAYHSDQVGYGVNDIKNTGVTWILLDWKMEVLKRPSYGEKLTVHTWGRKMGKFYTYRDYELYDEQGNLCAIATSKWVLVEAKKGKITRITEEVAKVYQAEEKSVFSIDELEKMEIPTHFTNQISYQANRRDMDINEHMHNLYYLDLAYEALPKDVYQNRPYDHVRISYKKEIKANEVVQGNYVFENNKHIVIIENQENKTLHAMIELY